MAAVAFDGAHAPPCEHAVRPRSPNGAKLPMSADAGQRCFVYQTLLAGKAARVSVTVALPNKRMFGTWPPPPHRRGSTYVRRSNVCGCWTEFGLSKGSLCSC